MRDRLYKSAQGNIICLLLKQSAAGLGDSVGIGNHKTVYKTFLISTDLNFQYY